MNTTISPEFAKALVQVQGNIEGAIKGKANPAFRSKYADLGACWDACRDALQEAGIAVLQFPSMAEPGHVGLTTCLVFGPTGEVLSERYQLPLKDPTNAQAGGSAITYARRYALCSIIGICPEDDDGNAASAPRKVRNSGPKDKSDEQGQEAGKDEAKRAWTDFGALGCNGDRKLAYSEVKASSIPEDIKVPLLAKMAEVIKANTATEKANQPKEAQ